MWQSIMLHYMWQSVMWQSIMLIICGRALCDRALYSLYVAERYVNWASFAIICGRALCDRALCSIICGRALCDRALYSLYVAERYVNWASFAIICGRALCDRALCFIICGRALCDRALYSLYVAERYVTEHYTHYMWQSVMWQSIILIICDRALCDRALYSLYVAEQYVPLYVPSGLCWTNVGLILAHRLRRWPSISPALVQCLVLAGEGFICVWCDVTECCVLSQFDVTSWGSVWAATSPRLYCSALPSLELFAVGGGIHGLEVLISLRRRTTKKNHKYTQYITLNGNVYVHQQFQRHHIFCNTCQPVMYEWTQVKYIWLFYSPLTFAYIINFHSFSHAVFDSCCGILYSMG